MPGADPFARRIGLVDHPSARKVHESVTPLTGGPALLLVLVALGAWWLPADGFLQALLAGGLLVFAVGLLDDFRDLSAALRFLAQIAACLLVIVWADVRLDDDEVPTRATCAKLAQCYEFVAGDGGPFVVHLSSPPKFYALAGS